MAKYIKAKTIWDAAKEKGLSTAALLWPVTCGAKIDYHMPEVHVRKGQNLILRSLLYGSKFFQLSALLKHGGKLVKALKSPLHDAGQIGIDSFTTAAACGLLKRKKPDLVLVHLISYDTIFHFAGSKGKEIEAAKKALDTNLGKLLELWKEDSVIVFSDHSQIEISENINLKDIYGNAVFEQVGGSAFLYKNSEKRAPDFEEERWFGRFLTKEEMEESGYSDKQVFGIAAKPGYCFSENVKYKGNHGYPADYDNYNVFYAVKSRNLKQGHQYDWQKNHITDITAIIVNELKICSFQKSFA